MLWQCQEDGKNNPRVSVANLEHLIGCWVEIIVMQGVKGNFGLNNGRKFMLKVENYRSLKRRNTYIAWTVLLSVLFESHFFMDVYVNHAHSSSLFSLL